MDQEMSPDDAPDQLRPILPDEEADEYPDLDDATEADPADVADQHRAVPVRDDEP